MATPFPSLTPRRQLLVSDDVHRRLGAGPMNPRHKEPLRRPQIDADRGKTLSTEEHHRAVKYQLVQPATRSHHIPPEADLVVARIARPPSVADLRQEHVGRLVLFLKKGFLFQ